MPNKYSINQSNLIVKHKGSNANVYRDACYRLLSHLELISPEIVSGKQLTDDDIDIADRMAAYYLDIAKNGRPESVNPYIVSADG